MRLRPTLLFLFAIAAAVGFQATSYKASPKPYPVSLTVDSVRFFESGPTRPPVNERVYRTRFKRSSLRYINWELVLTHPKVDYRVNFEIQAAWYGPTGNLLHRQPHRWFVPPGQGTSQLAEGWGCPDPPCNIWETGTYRVDFYQGERKVAHGSFEIIR
jgi:hypothetical protein